MSLLEDIFLQNEADEAQELERVIEGDEYDERPRSRSMSPDDDGDENVIGEDEAEEDKRRVDPSSTKTKRVTKNPRFILNPARLTGPRGIQVIPDHFKDFKFKGKGHEKEDLDMVLKNLEHWAYRLYPKFQFEDCLKKIETLGKKRPVMVHLHKIRTDQFLSEDTVVQKDSSDEETPAAPQEEDEFDKLLQQQIELARSTPAPGSVKKTMETPSQDRSPFLMPKATSSPSISDQQKERMIKNRKLAEERRLTRLKQNSIDTSEKQDMGNHISGIQEVPVDEDNVKSIITPKKHNRSNVIDSSDEEVEVISANRAVSVDVHSVNTIEKDNRFANDNPNKSLFKAGENNLEDIEMTEGNGKDNHVIELIKDKNVEINDQIYDNIEKNTVTDNVHKNIDENVELNDHVVKDFDRHGVNKVADKIVNENYKEKSNTADIAIEDNSNLLVDERMQITEVVTGIDDKSLENQNEPNHITDTSTEKDGDNVEKSITEETDNLEETHRGQADTTEETTLKSNKATFLKDCDANIETESFKETNLGNKEFTEDIMDVDFSEDF